MSTLVDAGRLICVGLAGTHLSSSESGLLRRLRPGGVILFRRNYENLDQLRELCAAVHTAIDPPPLVCVDQEGGRVVRLTKPFIRLPPARAFARENSPVQIESIAAVIG